MATTAPLGDLASRIDQLMKQRGEHTDAIARIDDTLGRIHSVLQGGGGAGAKGRPLLFGARTNEGSSNGPGRPRLGGGRRRRRSFATTGDESVIGFIRENKNATTADVKKHWSSEGRGGTADNTITKLVKEGKLKRIPLEGQRGSRYALP